MGLSKLFYKNKVKEIEEKASPINILTYRKLVWMKFKSHKLALIGSIILVALIIFCFFGPLFTTKSYEDMDFSAIFSPPSISSGHLLGTDELGHDVLIRIMYGGRISLIVGFLSALLTTVIGTIVGLLSGFYGGIVDRFLMRFVDIMLSIPMFPILLILTMVFGSGLMNIVMVLTVFGWMSISRLVRGLTLSLKESEYVISAKAVGVKNMEIILKHIFPNVLPIVIVSATLNVSYAILSESSLSYLGLGIQPPMPSWGNMLQKSMNYILGTVSGTTPWWLTFFPGLFIFLAVLNVNFLGDGLRDALDPKFTSNS
ncbi:MAG TPA: ABC transporter permease [Petrotogaceae bacterium]|nr:ABC transporter permease [Petrotogaceae bacterium]